MHDQLDTTTHLEPLGVVLDHPVAVLLVDTTSGNVIHANDIAHQLTPGVLLPVGMEQWSDAAGLRVVSGRELSDSSTPLGTVAIGVPHDGRQVTAALRSASSAAREALWAIGVPLHGAGPQLRSRSLVVMLPLRYPDSITEVQAAAADRRAHGTVLASSLVVTISDPTVEGSPITWASASFEHLTGWTPEEARGRDRRILHGPGTDPDAVARLEAGVAQRSTTTATLLSYRRDGSAFYDHIVVSPVFDAAGTVSHHVSVHSDVTREILANRNDDAVRTVVDRARHAQEDAEDADRLGQLLLSMSEALTATATVDQVAATVTDVLAPQLGASSGGLLLADPNHTHLRFVSTLAMPVDLNESWSRIGWDEDAPVAAAVRGGRAIFFRDVTDLIAAHPGVTDHADLPTMGASINLPLIAGEDLVGAIVLIWDHPRDLTPQQLTALLALARYTAQAVQRATLLAERRRTAEVLQQSLLTRLPEPAHLELRARYVPAAVGQSVGGDWYDAVVLPDGATALVIGDVTGHDITAAAHMGQLRGLLRAFAYDRDEPPAQIVGRLDRAVDGLHIDGLATLVLARIQHSPNDASDGARPLRWTNAGHPPPILLHADGTTELLDTVPERLIGIAPDAVRSDHDHTLAAGSTLLLYTDGLVEHPGADLDAGTEQLRRTLAACAGHTLEALLDHLVTELVGTEPDDDCALLAVRARPKDGPGPAR